jgi:hypothetical protein
MAKNKSNQRVIDVIKLAGAVRRQAHFDLGLPLSAWRGKHIIQTDKKKKASKQKCRGQRLEQL